MKKHAGHIITARLNALGKTQTWLARECDVSSNAVTKWIRTGHISRPNALKVAELLEVSVNDLMNQSDDNGSSSIPSHSQKLIEDVIERESREARNILLNLSPTELELVQAFRYATPASKAIILQVAAVAAKVDPINKDQTPPQ